MRQAEDLGRARSQPPAPGGQRDAAAGAHEKVVAEVAPQRRDGRGNGRLADAESLGSRVHRPEPGDHRERLQLRERHLPVQGS